ncbi:MAG: hypothetical protein NTW59_04460 [Candidatus Diapherotrites archaeon]|nr:hypothetical protein [Candidatus Diapherotrites archaeon]
MRERMGESGILAKLLNDSAGFFLQQNSFALKEAANRAIENAALANDKRMAEFAMVAYCLHKLLGKQHIVRDAKWKKLGSEILADLRSAADAMEGEDQKRFEESMHGIISSIESTDRQLGYFTQGLYEKARVKYASSAYALGLGLSQAAELTGANKKDLLNYIGATRMHDEQLSAEGIGERLAKLKQKLGGA